MWLPLKHNQSFDFRLKNVIIKATELKWGAWSLISLYISLASGIVVGLQYEYATPFFSTTSIDLIVPFGHFFRSLHFYSSQFFFFLTCFHLVAIYNKSQSYTSFEWMRLVTITPVILLLLFTGYVLRGDNTGASAGAIAENIVEAIPGIGTSLNSLLFSISQSGLRKVYLHHVITLDIVLLMLGWTHFRTYRIKVRNQLVPILVMILFSVIITAPLEPEQLGITYISGPWFFLGLQELLRYFPPLFAGVIVPGAFIVILLYAQPGKQNYQLLLRIIAIWLACYGVLSTIAWYR